MAYNGWQATIQTATGDALPLAEVTVRIGGPSGALATIYSDANGAAKSNPFFATSSGLAQFWAAQGLYYLVGSLDGQTTDGWYVSIGDASQPYASRAEAVASYVPAPVEKIGVISNGATFKYLRRPAGSTVADAACPLRTADGAYWLPDGDVYPEHWGNCGWYNGQSTATTNDTLVIKPALDYATSIRVALKFIGGKNYRLATSLVCNVSHMTMQSDSYRTATLWTTNSIGTAIDVFPVNPELSATSDLTNIRFSNLTLYPLSTNTSNIGIRVRRCTGVYTEGLILGGYFNAFKEENCRNIHHERMLGSDFNLSASAVGAAWYYRTGILMDGTTWQGGYTTRFNWLVVGGDNYDALVQVGHSDVMQYNHCYFGAAKRHILLKPDHPIANVGGQSFSQAYFDGVSVAANNTDCVVVDGNTYTDARLSRTVFSLCVFGQAKRAFVAFNGADLRFVSFSNCTFQNMDNNAVFIDADVGPKLDFNISGGFLERWGLVAGGDTDKEFGGRILKARSVTIDGVTINGDGSNRIPFRFENIGTLAYNGNNHLTTGTMYTQTSVTERVAEGNVGTGVFRENTELNSSGISPNPILKFGGVAVTDAGGTYSTRSVNWYRDGDWVTVNGNVTLSAKGTATGVATITLPIAPVSQGVVMGMVRPVNMTADAATPAYVLYIPSAGTELFLRKYGTTGAPGANELSDTAFANNTNINYTIRYRVA